MSWLIQHHKNKSSLFKRCFSFSASLAIASSSLIAIPATQAQAVNEISTATITKTSGSVLVNNELLTGTAADLDGLQSAQLRVVKTVGGAPITALLPVVVDANGDWSLQLTKAMTGPIDLRDSNVSIILTLTDVLADVTSVNLGSFHYTAPDADVFQSVIETLVTLDPETCPVAAALQNSDTVTVFGPNNEALQALPAEELQSLLSAPDELCSVVAGHIVEGAVAKDDVNGSVNAETLSPNTDPLTITNNADTVTVDNATVTNPDNAIVGGGFLHVVNALIHPVSRVVNINDVTTYSDSPALDGTVSDPTASVVVRVNGVSFNATNNGDGTWNLPAGRVHIDLSKPDALFSVVARRLVATPDPDVFNNVLIGITLRSDIIHVIPAPTAVAPTRTVVVAASNEVNLCGFICNNEHTSSTSVSVESAKTATQPKPSVAKTQDKKISNNQWYWWLIAVATLGALYYVLGGTTSPENK